MPRRRVAERREVLPDPDLQQPAGDEVHQWRDVGGKEVGGGNHLL